MPHITLMEVNEARFWYLLKENATNALVAMPLTRVGHITLMCINIVTSSLNGLK
jgi:hypothetical protein